MRESTCNSKYKRLIAALKEARHDCDLTQTELALALKRPPSFVAKYEQGERRLDLVEFLTVAKIVRLDVISLIKSLEAE